MAVSSAASMSERQIMRSTGVLAAAQEKDGVSTAARTGSGAVPTISAASPAVVIVRSFGHSIGGIPRLRPRRAPCRHAARGAMGSAPGGARPSRIVPEEGPS